MPAARTTSAQLLGCWHQHLLSRQNGLELAKCCCHWYELMIASQVRFRVVMLATPLLQGEGFAGFMPQQIGQTGAVPTERRHGNAVPQGAKRGQLPHGDQCITKRESTGEINCPMEYTRNTCPGHCFPPHACIIIKAKLRMPCTVWAWQAESATSALVHYSITLAISWVLYCQTP